MKLEQQVISLEQAKRLKELGVVQESCFWWKCNTLQTVVICGCTKEMNERHFSFNKWFSAFTVAELGVMLPLQHEVQWDAMYVMKNINYCHAILQQEAYGAYLNEAEARAAILIHLLENNIITPEEVNQRLI